MTSRFLAAGICLFISCVCHLPAYAGIFRYTGLCEASAAAVLDDSHFAVASDDSTLIRVFVKGAEAALDGGFIQPDVTDIEGAARIDDTIFWITSHSLNKNGKDKDERKLLFATTVADGLGLTAKELPYRDLREDIATAVAPGDQDFIKSFNIEGLAATASGTLLVGLRGPLSKSMPNHAYVVEISNPFQLLDPANGEKAEIVSVHQLKLFDDGETNGRGIRSLERVGERYIVVAGTVLDTADTPRIYSWDGTDKPTGLVRLPDVDLGGPVPEAMIAWGPRDIQLLGDNGDVKVDGEKCDDEGGEPEGIWFPMVHYDPGPP